MSRTFWVSYTDVLWGGDASRRSFVDPVAREFLTAVATELIRSSGPDAAIISDADGQVSLVGTFTAPTRKDAVAMAEEAFSDAITAAGGQHTGFEHANWESYSLDLAEVLQHATTTVRALETAA